MLLPTMKSLAQWMQSHPAVLKRRLKKKKRKKEKKERSKLHVSTRKVVNGKSEFGREHLWGLL